MKQAKRNYKALLLFVMFVMIFMLSASFCIINVQAAPKINKKSVTLIKGQTTTLKIKNNKKKVKWSSSQKTIATVTSKGKVTAKKAGTAIIAAKVGSKKFTCKIKVEAPSMSSKTLSIIKGSATALKLNGTTQKVTWKSSNKKVATVNSKGKVTAKKKGTTTITATVLKKKYTCKVTVKNKEAFSASKAVSQLSKKVVETDDTIYYFVTNNYNQSVVLSSNILFYRGGSVASTDIFHLECLAPGKTGIVIYEKPVDVNNHLFKYDNYKVSFKAEENIWNKSHEKLTYKITMGTTSPIIAVTNNGNTGSAFRFSALYYKNGKIIDNEYHDHYIESNSTEYIECNEWIYGFEKPDDMPIPDDFKAFIE